MRDERLGRKEDKETGTRTGRLSDSFISLPKVPRVPYTEYSTVMNNE